MCAHYRYASSATKKSKISASASLDPSLSSAIANTEQLIRRLRLKRKEEAEKAAASARENTKSKELDAHAAVSSARPLSTREESKQRATQKRLHAKANSATSAKIGGADAGEAIRDDSAYKFRLNMQTKLLIHRQKTKLPHALEALKRNRRKVGHWAWW